MTTITVSNNFHGTKAKIKINTTGETILSKRTVNRVRRELCGIKGCHCGGVVSQQEYPYVPMTGKLASILPMPRGEAVVILFNW